MTDCNCPRQEELRQYALGSLLEDRATALEEHFRRCPRCETTLQSMENLSDTLLSALRQPARTQFKEFFNDPTFAEAVRKAGAIRPQGEVSISGAAMQPYAGPRTVNDLLQLLVSSGLMTGDAVHGIGQRLPALDVDDDPRLLIERLVQDNQLTAFQAEAICHGKTQGLVLGNYILLDVIGQGGMGRVYKVWHTKMNRVAALKVLPAAGSAETVRRFQREVKAAAMLAHPNIVTAHDAGEAAGVHFLVMEYVEGTDLGTLVKQSGPLAVADAVDCTLQAARGLKYAHGRGIVHRDIKPSNFLRDSAGTVKILDMGLARIGNPLAAADAAADGDLTHGGDLPHGGTIGRENGAARDDGLTHGGQVMGTLSYMSPEQAQDAHVVDARSDIYSLGCTLYYLLTGKPPYSGETAAGKILLHRDHSIPSLQAARPDVPEPLEAVFQKMLAKTPDQRQASMAEVIAALEACPLSNGAGSAGPVPAAAPVRRAIRRRIYVATALVGLAALACLAVMILRVKTKDGTLILQLNDADVTVQVVNADGTPQKEEKNVGKGPLPLSVPQGKHRIRVLKDGQELFAQDFVLKAGEQRAVDVKYEPKTAPRPGAPLASAPFDAAKAKQLQEAWAKQLGLPLENRNSVGMTLVLIPPGEFDMGLTKDEVAWAVEQGKKNKWSWYADRVPSAAPRHRVKISKPFYLGMHLVTQGEYRRVMGVNPSSVSAAPVEALASGPPLSPQEKAERALLAKRVAGADTSRHPVETVSWAEAMEFCRKLSMMSGELASQRVYRLPTEAEWEYACRAGSAGKWTSGDAAADVLAHGWFADNSAGVTHPVGQKLPNAWGLYDMHGNVWQWCADWYAADYYQHSPPIDPAGPAVGASRVLRGGAWYFSPPHGCSASRFCATPDRRSDTYGFRVVCSR